MASFNQFADAANTAQNRTGDLGGVLSRLDATINRFSQSIPNSVSVANSAATPSGSKDELAASVARLEATVNRLSASLPESRQPDRATNPSGYEKQDRGGLSGILSGLMKQKNRTQEAFQRSQVYDRATASTPPVFRPNFAGVDPRLQAVQQPGPDQKAPTAIGRLVEKIDTTLSRMWASLPSARQFGKSTVMSRMPSGTEFMSDMTKRITEFVEGMGDAIKPLKEFADIATHFVEAIDPALVAELGRAFRDLQAVVGQALRPVVDQTREIVRYLGGSLMPLMRRLEPIVADLSGKVGERLKEMISRVTQFLERIPWETIGTVIGSILDIIGDVTKTARAFIPVIVQAFDDLLTAILGASGEKGAGGVKDLMAQVRTAVQNALRAVVMFAASVMKVAGWMNGLDALIKGLEEKAQGPRKVEDDRGLAVMGASIKALQDLGRGIYEQAYMASAYGAEKRDPAAEAADFLKGIADDIRKLPSKEEILDPILRSIDAIYEQSAEFVEQKSEQYLIPILQSIEGFYDYAVQKYEEYGDAASAVGKGVDDATRTFRRGVMPGVEIGAKLGMRVAKELGIQE